MAQSPYSAQIDLGLGNPPGEFMHFGAGPRSGYLAREPLNFLRHAGSESTGRLRPWDGAFPAERPCLAHFFRTDAGAVGRLSVLRADPGSS
jgi:hypothetical protein